MRLPARCLSASALSVICVAATTLSASAGEVTLQNKDVLTGTVTRSDDAGVTIEHAELGTLDLPREQVRDVKISKSDPIFEEQPEPDFFWGWEKSLSAGVTGSKGNTDTFSSYAEFETENENDTDRWFMHARVFYGEEDGDNTRNEYEAGLTKDWLYPGKPEFFWGSLLYEHDRFTGWRDRTSGFLGIGYTFIDRDNHSLIGRLGAGGNYEAGLVDEFTPELYAGLEGVWKINTASTFKYYTTFYPSLDPAFDEFRNVTGASYQIKVDAAKGLSLKVGAENEFNSEVEPGTKKNDFKYYAALVLDF